MKAFLVGLVVLISFILLSTLGILLAPFLLVLAVFLRLAIGLILILFAIWILGKISLWCWEALRAKKTEKKT